MKAWYIKISTYGTDTPFIVDERGIDNVIYSNFDDFMFLCDASCLDDAKEKYLKEIAQWMNETPTLPFKKIF